jgi:hypothetical protein
MLFLSNYYHSKIPQFVINANDENVSAQDQNSRKEFWTGILGGFCVLAAPPIEIAGIYIWKGYNNGMREYKHSRLVLYLSPSSLKIVGLF